METRKGIEQEVEAVYRDFMETYYIHHNIEKSINFLHPQFNAIGTGEDEEVENIEKARELFSRDFNQAPNPVYIHYHFIKCIPISDNVCTVLSSYKLNTVINNLPLELNNIRSTMIFTKYREKWKIFHSHISIPFVMQKKGESFPLEALKRRSKILRSITKEKMLEIGKIMQELERVATTDKITNIYNRAKFEHILHYETKRAKRYDNPLSLIMFDIDNFKEINDTLGHIVGDNILYNLASFVKTLIRESDIFARWGGDEFVILSPSTDLKGAEKLGQKIRKRVSEYDFGIGRPVTISLGITQYRYQEDEISLIEKIDKLLYMAKQGGRNTIKVG